MAELGVDDDGREVAPRRPRGQLLAIALVCVLSGVIAGFVLVALVAGGEPADPDDGEGGDGDAARAVSWRPVSSTSGRYVVDLPGEPVDDEGVITLGVDRTVPVATRHATTPDGTTATIAEFDYSAVLGDDEYDLRLGGAGAVERVGGTMNRFEEVSSPLGPAASFAGSGDDVEVQGYLVANGGHVVLLLVTAPAGSDAAAAGILQMVSSLSTA